MTRSGLWRVAAHVLALSIALPAAAAEPKVPKTVLVEQARELPGGHGVAVTVAQPEISSNINPSIATLVLAGGLIGAVIDAKVDADRGKRAQAGIAPVQTALIDFDADQLAIDATTQATTALPWFQAHSLGFTRDPTPAAKSALLDKSDPSQVAFFDYVYDTSPDFASIRVGLTLILAPKALAGGGAPEKRLSYRNLAYAQTLTSVIQLPNPGAPEENARRWAAQDGALAKRALKLAFADVSALTPRALALTVDDITRMKTAEKATLGAYSGKLVERTADGALLYGLGFIHVQTLSE